MDIVKILIVGLGGLIGSVSRYVTVRFVDIRLNAVFPYGTLTVNIVGSFLLGMIFMLTQKGSQSSEEWRLFLGTGFCGGFTTFSAFALENALLMDQKLFGTALMYIAASLVAGILAMTIGMWCTRFL